MGDGNDRLERQLWLALYACILLAPLVLLAFAPPKGADRLDLFAVGMGFVGFMAIVLQLVLPSRAPQFTQAVGIGPLLRLHRYVGYAVVVIIALHIGVFAWHRPEYAQWLWPPNARDTSYSHNTMAKAWLGWIAAVALWVLVVTSVWRGLLRLRYEAWRLLHLLLGATLLGAAFVHIMLVSWYTAVTPLRTLVVIGLVIGLVAIAYLRFGRPFAALGAPFVIVEVRPERGNATTLQLEAAGGHPGLPFRPGQFAWIKVMGRPYALREHPFSFSSSSATPQRPSFTIKGLGDFTTQVGALTPGTPVLIDGPHGAYEPLLPHAGFVLVVAGVGITPAMSFLRTYADLHDARPIQLVYGSRTWEDITFREELDHLRTRLNVDIVHVLSSPPPGWTGETGRINEALLRRVLPHDAAARNYFVCGPPEMIDGVLDALNSIGVRNDLVYADRFDSV